LAFISSKAKHPAGEKTKASGVSFTEVLRVNSPQVDIKKNRNQSTKNKAPRRFFAWSGGVLIPDKPSEEGVRLSRTSNQNLTTWTEETKPPQAKRDDSRGECYRMKKTGFD